MSRNLTLSAALDPFIELIREADLSFSERYEALNLAIRADEYNPDGSYRYVESVYDTWFVFRDYRAGEADGFYKASYAIDDNGAATLGTPSQVRRVVTWEDIVSEANRLPEGVELIEGEFIRLVEVATNEDGSSLVKIIIPGWSEGSKVYYAKEVLKRDCAAAFPAGTKMFWNHLTLQEQKDRPEGDLDKFAAVFTEAAHWDENGVAGPAPYARIEVKEHYKAKVKDLAKDIGVSIYAAARVEPGEAEGRKGRIVTELLPNIRNSVDFVTYPGAGGEIVSLFEAARPDFSIEADNKPNLELEPANDMTPEEIKALEAKAAKADELEAANARLALYPTAREAAQKALVGTSMPQVTRESVIEAQAKAPAMKEDGSLDVEKFTNQVKEAAKVAVDYLKEAGLTLGGTSSVRGAGGGAPANTRESAGGEAPTVVREARAGLGLI